jgi:hypothetical protein
VLTDEQLARLPDDPEMAFVEVVAIMDQWLIEARARNEPYHESHYAQTIKAFADEFNLEVPFRGYQERQFKEWGDYWDRFLNDVRYAAARFQFRHRAATPTHSALTLNADRRNEIHGLIVKIRKVVAVLDVSEDKRDAIYGKLAALAREVDQSRTRPQTLMALTLEVAGTLGAAAEKLKPVARLVNRITSIVADQKDDDERQALPKPEERKQLSGPDESAKPKTDDEIPF